ncbi:hypothetical protein [Chitinilyticum aquatile]|nr:hypothetical protein [Chitinilyticum aquatile]
MDFALLFAFIGVTLAIAYGTVAFFAHISNKQHHKLDHAPVDSKGQ